MKSTNKSAGSMAATLTKRQVKQMIGSKMEHKIYTGASSGTFTTAGALIYKTPMAEDDDYFGRTGLVINPIAYRQRLVVSSTVSGYYRVIVFQDTMANGASPAVTDVLAAANTNSQHNPINVLNRRFKFLSDDLLCTSVAGEAVRFVEHVIKLKGQISFLSTGATSASAGKNAIFTLVIGQDTTGAYDMKTALTYTDA
jgi:hypothetical protein